MPTVSPQEPSPQQPESNADAPDDMRRRFLIRCGKFAAVTPPAIALILAESNRNYAMALSGGSHAGGYGHGRGHHFGGGDHWHHRRHFANNGFGNGGHDGVPGHSGSSHGRDTHDKVADSRR
jgi:hypothetical protein